MIAKLLVVRAAKTHEKSPNLFRNSPNLKGSHTSLYINQNSHNFFFPDYTRLSVNSNMAPTDSSSLLSARYYYGNNGYYGHSNWYYYGRWIFAGVVIVAVIFIFFLWACINSRRRRKRGLKPMYGTGWMANNQQGYQNNPHGYSNGYQNAPPAYGAPQGQSYPMQNQYTGNTFNANDGYYGQHEGIQQPKDAHTTANGNTAATGDYAPPPGPPPPGNKPAY